MTRHWHVALAVLVVAASLVGGLVVVVRAQSTDGPPARPAISVPPTTPSTGDPASDSTSPVGEPGTPVTPTPLLPPAPTPGRAPTGTAPTAAPPPTPVPTPTAKSPSPTAGTVYVDDRYRQRYGGRYVGWDDLVDAGDPLPKITGDCRSEWRAATKDEALDWDRASYLCLDALTGKSFKPQGVGGSGATEGYLIGTETAGSRNLVVVSSYSTTKEKGLRFPHTPGKTDATRLTVIDLDRGRYNHVELVRPVGRNTFAGLDSHGSGFVWVGQYMYSSSLSTLWMYNADDLMEIDGRYVLPAVARWSVKGDGGFSSIGIDRSTSPTTITGINYNQNGTAWAQSLELDADGRLQQGESRAENELNLTSTFGPGPSFVRSTRSAVVPGSNFQGIGTAGPYRLVNSSSLKLGGRRIGDTVVIFKKNKVIARFSMPNDNIESVYVDYWRSTYVTVTEHGKQFLFWMPLDHLIDRAER